jgi:hypothetical protein
MITQAQAVAKLKGALRSITIWVAAIAEVLGEIAPYVPSVCATLGLEPTTTNHVLRVVAVAMVICRAITTKSLEDKVPSVVPSAPIQTAPIQKGFIVMKMLFALTAAAVVAMSLSACATLESPGAAPFEQVAVNVGVDTLVGTNVITKAARAAAIYKIASEILAADTGTVTTVDQLLGVVNAKVAALGLPPGDQQAALLFTGVVEAAVNQYLSQQIGGATGAQVQVAISTVAKWVIAEAAADGGA